MHGRFHLLKLIHSIDGLKNRVSESAIILVINSLISQTFISIQILKPIFSITIFIANSDTLFCVWQFGNMRVEKTPLWK